MPRASRVGPGDSQARRLAGTDTVHHPGRVGQGLAKPLPIHAEAARRRAARGRDKGTPGSRGPRRVGTGRRLSHERGRLQGARPSSARRQSTRNTASLTAAPPRATAGAPTSPDAPDDGRGQEPRHATRPGASGNAVGPDEAGRNSRSRQRAGRDVGPRGSPRSWSVRDSDPRAPASPGLWEIPHARDTWPRAVSSLQGATPSPPPRGLVANGVCDARHPPRDVVLASVSCERQRERRSPSPANDIRPLSAGERRGATAP